ncbi:hypothetical protein MJO28_012392 [Puccinia striiformis f. sp. tritici]|uniref:Actin cortical patch SUR7/pH-response regulator PalI n=3 Tax=Puccinia striiformis TaxID=27350 RepID=A0A2S4W7A2_9BASI|nr:hypothetical protein Pst134EA_022708 [Puccinia striiformis f. sp. tritici]KAI9611732.1 hypothetical protein KEM48_004475 [Puccinia striiformis f. sp. tritici PST-130]POW17638.1 hypothetical protein PSTT_00473 [Puccinia striiformis]KAH9445746.1 hypothetical protein Pst134EB_023581 [Puccinia striiformis f. sp. tritici]KAH9455236.1 hypothetical protein Pst134EA_022708 [Puccinia striiformis f. sp. tritici]KAI7942365.1 hypothetical protein MJO28_012392 [Puccinia striiformis f. sp. tritici]
MGNPVASAGGGIAFVAAVLFIFVGIANFTLDQVVPRHIRFVQLTTQGLGAALANGRGQARAVYGDPSAPDNQRNIGDGLRLFYTWGLWNRCAGYVSTSDPQYCTETSWAYRFEPTAALIEDVPNGLKDQATNLLNGRYNADHYFGVWSRIGFYFIFIAACLVGLILLFSLIQARGPGRLGSLNLSVISLLAFISNLIGTVIWTAIAGILKRQLNRDSIGMSASFGNAIWLLWAISGLLLFASFGYLGGCIRGRRSQAVV